ncbi:translational GTPase TypA [Peredibacter starrii]|uniref:50S ribosomal subunit assembly factor BipA n=1 Tax=Peredibacter starrii TaxID=28202 RepID=A0AAX4HT60_9BACT|nr:translational GTPase TypA [Peredibacter starrii]WPU66380.1 translational GTPase TypA [Peredibacter starrii]
MKLKNIAVVAHVDHGKTTLVDQLLKYSGTFSAHEQVAERVMDSGELERERGITIKAKNCAIRWKETKVNLLDTPGHADFGGEVERSLMMVDGILLLVDASEGPLPQTRFVLTKALERGIRVGVFINKVDRADERIDEVRGEVEDLLLEIASNSGHDIDLDIPFYYGSGRNAYASKDKTRREGNMDPLLDFLVSDYYPSPNFDKAGSAQLLVTNLSYSNYLGSLMVGRITRGKIENSKQIAHIGADGKVKPFKVSSLQIYDGLGMATVDSAEAGEIVIISGFENGDIGDTLAAVDNPEALPRIEVEPPTVSVQVSVSTSPMSGREGEYLTSRKLEEFLIDAIRKNVSLKYEPTEDPKVFILKARGELQVAVVFEEIRRAGYELMIARPQVITKEIDGVLMEPFERLVLDVPDDSTGAITEKMATRKGRLEAMAPFGEGRTRMEFHVPSRGLIGYRSTFLTDTRGQGLMSSYFVGYEPHVGKMLARQNGALISDRAGKITPYALFNLLSSGKQFVLPTEQTYEGQVVGEHTRPNDLNVNVCREKHLSSVRTAGKDENIILPPIPPRTLDWALDWIDDDEWVEVTPKNIRIRKKELNQNMRKVTR